MKNELPRYVYAYGCVKCQTWHYDNQEGKKLYQEHILYQSKHGITRQVNPEHPEANEMLTHMFKSKTL
jgi:hypothetical protein